MGHISIAKRTIDARKTETITTDPDLAISVWVEKGTVEVLSTLDGCIVGRISSEGSVSLVGTVHLRNPGKTAARVFVATASLAPASPRPTARSPEKSHTRSLPPQLGLDLTKQKSVVICDDHGLVTQEPLTDAGCEAVQRKHIQDFPACEDLTSIEPSP